MLRVVIVVTLLMSLLACSSTHEWKGVYKADGKNIDGSKLEVPPDLSEPDISDSLALPNIALSGSTYSAFTNTEHSGVEILPAGSGDVKVFRDGKNQWLEIKAAAKILWPQLKSFFRDVGFEIKREHKTLGVIETNWVENRYNLPTGWFAKMFKGIMSTGLRDKYRARLEKTSNPNITRVFITHQGLAEHATDDNAGVAFQKYWERRPSDPELEAEMNQRFLIYRKIGKATAKQLASTSAVADRSRIIKTDDSKVLEVKEDFARTWRRVGIALDRIGLLVEDRNRSGGLYYLRITEDFRDKVKDEDQGWFDKLFSSGNVKLKERYLLNVNAEKDKVVISIYEPSGKQADIRFVDKLLSDLKTYLD